MSLTAEQLEERRAYLGGTDAAALAGVNPPRWSQPIDVYLDKTGASEPRPPSKLMALGSLMEDLVATLATEATGMRWRRWTAPVRSRDYPWAGGHLDRLAAGYVPDGEHLEPGLERALLECKTATSSSGWGEQGTTLVPAHYMVQVQHYLAVTGRPVAILAVLLGYADFRWYRLERDDALITNLMRLEERFWRENVLAGVPPEPDGSESYGDHLRRKLAQDSGEELPMTPEQVLLAGQLRVARGARDAIAQQVAELEQRLQASMGTATRLIGPGVTVTWRQNKPSTRVRWAEYVASLLAAQGLHPEKPTKKAAEELVRAQALAAGMADVEDGARPFRVEFEDEEA
jgi:putative phage-type endonuclease